MPNSSLTVIPECFYRKTHGERNNSEIPAQKIGGNDMRIVGHEEIQFETRRY